MKKRILSIVTLCCALVFALSLAACGGSSSSSENATTKSGSDQSSTESSTSSEEQSAKDSTPTASVGNTTFFFNNQKQFFDVSYNYPNELELEEDTSHPRDLLRYRVEGYDPVAFGVVVGLVKGMTPDRWISEEKHMDMTEEEINGVTWFVGTKTKDDGSKNTMYACKVGDDTYTVSFATDYANEFDFTDFAKVFMGEMKVQ